MKTAYHEAGHVVMAVLLGGRVRQVTVTPDRDDGPDRYGDTQVLWLRGRDSDRIFARKLVLTALAGPVAEMIYEGEPLHPGFVAEWADDWRQAFAAAAVIVVAEHQRVAWLEEQIRSLYHQLDQEYWPAVAALADELAAHETLEEEQILEALHVWLPDSP